MKKVYVIAVIAIVAVLFYRYDYRPSEVRKNCEAEAKQNAAVVLKEKATIDGAYRDAVAKNFYMYSDYENMYKQCLRSQGFEPQKPN